MKTGTDPDSHVTVKEIIIIYCFPRLYRSIILLIVVECENSHPTEAKGRLTCKRGISYQVIQINRNNCRKEITSCDTCMVWVSFCQIFLSQEEISKSAGKWVFCGMNQNCLQMGNGNTETYQKTFLKYAKRGETMHKRDSSGRHTLPSKNTIKFSFISYQEQNSLQCYVPVVILIYISMLSSSSFETALI